MNQNEQKKAVGYAAVKLIKNGMKIGIGTGSTVYYFIEALKKRHQEETLEISCICTSKTSEKLLDNQFSLLDEKLSDTLDMTFDGADRINDRFELIKGGGGALLREKMVALRSKKNIVLVDATKWTNPLEGFPVAIEIVPFAYASTIERIEQAGYQGSLRQESGTTYITDNHNYIFDLHFHGPINNPTKHHHTLKMIPGVVETGFFINTATSAFLAKEDGSVEERKKP